jgi:hypothetical protein
METRLPTGNPLNSTGTLLLGEVELMETLYSTNLFVISLIILLSGEVELIETFHQSGLEFEGFS